MMTYKEITACTDEELRAALEKNRNADWDLSMKDRWTWADRDYAREIECEYMWIVNEMKKRGMEV